MSLFPLDTLPALRDGALLEAQEEWDKAIAHYRKAVEMMPQAYRAHNNLGAALQRQGKMEEAISHFREVLKVHPDNVEVLNNLGATLASQGEEEEAIRHCVEHYS